MKFTYEYRTSDNTRHTGVVVASDREAAFQRLKAQGIRPGRLTEAPGFLNHLFGKGKRWLVIGVLSALCLVLCAIALHYSREARNTRHGTRSALHEARFLTDTTRRQIIGDVAIIEKGIRTGWADVFEREGDRFLASFAIPGVKAGVRNTSVEALEDCLGEVKVKGEGEQRNLSSSSNAPSTKHQALSASLEARQITAIVEGMKREARAYVAAGGTAVEYGKRLTERQDAEIALFERVEAEMLSARKSMPESAFSALLDRRNDELRNLGIRPVTMPE